MLRIQFFFKFMKVFGEVLEAPLQWGWPGLGKNKHCGVMIKSVYPDSIDKLHASCSGQMCHLKLKKKRMFNKHCLLQHIFGRKSITVFKFLCKGRLMSKSLMGSQPFHTDVVRLLQHQGQRTVCLTSVWKSNYPRAALQARILKAAKLTD